MSGDIVRRLIEKYRVTLPYAAGSDLLADRRIGCAFDRVFHRQISTSVVLLVVT